MLNGTDIFTFRDSNGFEKPSTHSSDDPVAIKPPLLRCDHLVEYDVDLIPHDCKIQVRRLAVVAAAV